jgi:S1-C subfamily serine protease
LIKWRSWTTLSGLLIIVLVISTSGLTIFYFNLSRNFNTLSSELNEASSQIKQLRSTIERATLISDNPEISGLTPQQIYSLVEPSIVKITIRTTSGNGLTSSAQGSGFIYSKDGFIVTNNHVVVGADAIEVTFLDGTIVRADLVGTDPYSDLAVIRTDQTLRPLQPILIGNSSRLHVGDPVLAIGNPFGLSGSMTRGIISQLNRTLNTEYGYLIVGVIQTDASINPGNSGGPLLNMWGEIVGVNSAIISKSGESSGVGFAIPSNLMVRVVTALIKDRRYVHPWLGLAGVDVTPAVAEAIGLNYSGGFLVTYVTPESPVGKAGVKAGDRYLVMDGQRINIGGDVIVGIDNVKVRRLEDLLVYIEFDRKPHETVTLHSIRDKKPISMEVELEERP